MSNRSQESDKEMLQNSQVRQNKLKDQLHNAAGGKPNNNNNNSSMENSQLKNYMDKEKFSDSGQLAMEGKLRESLLNMKQGQQNSGKKPTNLNTENDDVLAESHDFPDVKPTSSKNQPYKTAKSISDNDIVDQLYGNKNNNKNNNANPLKAALQDNNNKKQ